MFNSDNLSIVSEARNVQVTFAEEPHNNQFSKVNMNIHSCSDKAVQGTDYRCESGMPLFTSRPLKKQT